jgi:thiamine transporter
MEKREKLRRNLLALCEGAILIAVAQILSLIPLWKYPWGGSVDLAMLPILLFCVRWGFGPAAITCFVHGTLQMLLSSSSGFVGWQSFLGDYLFAYGVLCVAGLFKGKFLPAAAVGCVARFLVHYAVGATIWAEWMPETFFGMTMSSPWIYSGLYNGAYMLPCLALVLVAYLLLMQTPAKKFFRAEDLQA